MSPLSLKKRFDYVYQDEIFLAAAFLDYQFKNFEIMSKVDPNNAKLVLKQIKKYIIEFYPVKSIRAQLMNYN